jgi:tetratricopeptide (TPR) repeat protein
MRVILLIGLCWLMGSVASAAGDDDKKALAKKYFETGMVLYDRGDFLDAARDFERAYHESQIPAFMYNIASAYDKGGERAKAVTAYRKYAELSKDPNEVASAKKRADVLEREWKELEAAKVANKPEVRKMPPALPFVEPVSKATFQTWVPVEGKPYTLLGAGARKYFGYKIYGMALYIEDEPARAAFPRLAAQAGGSDHATLVRGDLVNQWLVMQDFGKMAVLRFLRDVKAKDTRDSYREALGETASKKQPGELQSAVEQFLALFDDVKEGDELVIRTGTDGQVIVECKGQKKMGPKNIKLSHDIWDIWMGSKPISADLKKTLVDRIDTLGR